MEEREAGGGRKVYRLQTQGAIERHREAQSQNWSQILVVQEEEAGGGGVERWKKQGR